MSKRWLNSSMSGSQRARRFAIGMPIQYRGLDAATWLDGWVENISRTGVVFLGQQGMNVSTPIQMRFELPAEIGGQVGALVICRGEIVRANLQPGEDGQKMLAATILDYSLVRGADGRKP